MLISNNFILINSNLIDLHLTFNSLRIQTPEDGEILLDYSKNRINDEILQDLFTLAKVRKVEEARNAMFSGSKINVTEGRAVLHIALRNLDDRVIEVDGVNVMTDVKRELDHMKTFTEAVLNGQHLG